MAVQAGCSISEMGQRIPSSEWPYFLAFFELEPWGFQANDYHAALISSTIANSSGKTFKTQMKISDYMRPEPLTQDQLAKYEEAKKRYGE